MKLKSFSLTAVFLLLFTVSAYSQSSTPPPENEDVLKISTNLIQIDVTVTDKKGKIVTDLKPEDFEIYENGKKQEMSNFSFVTVSSAGDSPENIKEELPKEKKKYSLPPPPVKLKAEQVRRTYALVVDDLGLSFSSVFFVKEALKKFVNEQMQTGDLVAVIRTGSGIGATVVYFR